MPKKFLCTECDRIVKVEEVLRAPNPFLEGDEIRGCPHCFEVNFLVKACDEPECLLQASLGTPTDSGYVWSCYDHRPKVIDPEE